MSSICAEHSQEQTVSCSSLPQKVGGKIRFTPANARLFAAKAHAARKAKFVLRTHQQTIAEIKPAADLPPQQPLTPPDSYTGDRLSRVRSQLDRLDVMMQTETDPQRLDRLASAQAKLAEQERQLAGRPLPGSLRPSNRPAAGGMIEQPQTSAPGPSSMPPVQSEAQE